MDSTRSSVDAGRRTSVESGYRASVDGVPDRKGDGPPKLTDGGDVWLSDEPREVPPAWHTWNRILEEARPEFWSLALATFFLLLSSVFYMALPYFAGQILDQAIAGSSGQTSRQAAKDQLDFLILVLLACTFVGSLAAGIRQLLFNAASEKVMARVRNKLFASLCRQEMGFYDRNQTGNLLSRISSDTDKLKDAATINVSIFLRSAANFIAGMVIMFITSWLLTLLTLAIVPVAVVCSVLYGRWIRELSMKTSASAARAAATASDSMSAIRTVKSFHRQEGEKLVFGISVAETLDLGIAQAWAQGIFGFLASVLFMGTIAIVFWYGAYQVVDDKMSTGELQAFILYSISIAANLGMAAGVFGAVMQAIGSSTRVFELIDREPHMKEEGTLKPFENAKAISVEFKDVHFAYPARPDVKVLDGFNLVIDPGSTTALVGSSGSGKSTVTSILQHFYEVTEGEVLLQGVPVREIDPEHLHLNLGIVSQEPVLFARSIRDNIAFGIQRLGPDTPVNEADIIAAAKEANAHEFIASYPDGYDTYVGERGVQLSGGQKQRLAIARALLADPQFLLLDEATSALDAESEHLVVQALERLMKGRTSLVIAHRLSTIKNADKIALMKKGRVVECGTHEELLAIEDGQYKALVKRQLTGEDSDVEA